ncbi:MAG: DUF2141 domain-containing protein [Bacteroidetes bacterium]|nr:DUF2141 domain-containing protein [Bacteroidota bacterium]
MIKRNIFLMLLFFSFSSAFALSDSLSTLRIVIHGAVTDSGKIMVAVSDSEKNYMTPGMAFKAAALDINEGKSEWVIDSIPYGSYAIKVFHDVNSNQQLDTKSFGIPSEPYGFSNNAAGRFGPPSWKDAHFDCHEREILVEIKLK